MADAFGPLGHAAKPRKRVLMRFYAELNEFLPPSRRHRAFEVLFDVAPTVRDLIESAGVPHTEVDLVLVNGESSGLSRIVDDGDRISVYPVFESLDIADVSLVRPEPLRTPRFVLDVHLGRLASYLRMAGFDTVYRNAATDPELARISAGERRILLTRDVGLLKRAAVTRGYYIRGAEPRAQLAEVVRRFELERLLRPFSRCMACNGELRDAGAASVQGRVPAGIAERHREFQECPDCGRVYWKGSHYDRMREMLERLSRGYRSRSSN